MIFFVHYGAAEFFFNEFRCQNCLHLISRFQMTVPSHNASTNGQAEDMDIDQENGNPPKKQRLMSKEDLERVMDDIEKHSLDVNEKW